MPHFGPLSLTIFIADWVLRVVLAVRVILRRTPVPMTLSWLLMLLLVPVPFLGTFVYLLVGENRLGSRRIRQFNAVNETLAPQAVQFWNQANDPWPRDDDLFESLARLGTAVGGLPPTGGNQLELMDDAGAVIKRLVEDIDRATSHVHLLYYIWMTNGGGIDIAEAVIRATKRGVQCRVLVDGVGSRTFLRSPLAARLRSSGAQLIEALPVNPIRLLLSRLDLRNHRKIAVIDGAVAYCGSQNITDATFRNRRRSKVGPWLDTTVRLEGHAAQALQTVFLTDWAADSDERLPSLSTFFPKLPDRPPGSIVHVIPSGPGPQPDAIHQTVLSMIFAAREELVMTTPYFVPDEATKSALINAALRGVHVSIIVPDKLDTHLVAAASRSHYEDLLHAGVRIFEHRGGLLHAKTAVIDRRLGFVGSVNFDMRSFWLNFEATLFIYDDDFASVLRFLQTSYLQQCDEIFLDVWRQRPLHRRFLDNTAQLLSPLL